MFWNEYIIVWSARNTRHVALITTETELIAVAEGLKSASYLKNVNSEIFHHTLKLNLYKNNQGCINWLQNPAGHLAKAIHTDICYRFARELCHEEVMDVTCVPSDNQIVVILTKALSVANHKRVMQLNSYFSASGECWTTSRTTNPIKTIQCEAYGKWFNSKFRKPMKDNSISN